VGKQYVLDISCLPISLKSCSFVKVCCWFVLMKFLHILQRNMLNFTASVLVSWMFRQHLQGNSLFSEQTCPSVTLSAKSPTSSVFCSNPNLMKFVLMAAHCCTVLISLRYNIIILCLSNLCNAVLKYINCLNEGDTFTSLVCWIVHFVFITIHEDGTPLPKHVAVWYLSWTVL
jgi:hypothetical protein